MTTSLDIAVHCNIRAMHGLIITHHDMPRWNWKKKRKKSQKKKSSNEQNVISDR